MKNDTCSQHRIETQLTCFQEDMGNEALVGHAMDLGNLVETLLGSYLCTTENTRQKKFNTAEVRK
jgi:phosphohistidine phosphatase SixA